MCNTNVPYAEKRVRKRRERERVKFDRFRKEMRKGRKQINRFVLFRQRTPTHYTFKRKFFQRQASFERITKANDTHKQSNFPPKRESQSQESRHSFSNADRDTRGGILISYKKNAFKTNAIGWTSLRLPKIVFKISCSIYHMCMRVE